MSWHTTRHDDLADAIAEFKEKLPGWWYTLGECQVSCDASCAPTTESEHIRLIDRLNDPFDVGFDADLPQPSTLAEALRSAMQQALDAIVERDRGSVETFNTTDDDQYDMGNGE